jgi:outer membrane immunogenic protein
MGATIMAVRGFLKISLVAAVLVSTAVAARAADPNPPYRGAPPVPLAYDWTGFYIGAHIGVGWGGGDNGDAGFLGGGQAGFNYQVNQWVLGVEGQFSGTTIKDSVSASFFVPGVGVGFASAEASLDWVSTLAVRAGWAFDRWLVYGKVGGAWAHVSADAFAGIGALAVAVSADKTTSGWMLGLGTEYALRDNWTAKFEYNMLDFGNDLDGTVHVLKAGVNYRFGFNPAPVYSRY